MLPTSSREMPQVEHGHCIDCTLLILQCLQQLGVNVVAGAKQFTILAASSLLIVSQNIDLSLIRMH